MATYTITLSDTEDAVVKELAAAKARETGQPVTAAALLQNNVSVILRPYIDGFMKRREDMLLTSFRAATEVEKQAVEAALPKGK